MNDIFETHAHYDDEAFDTDRDVLLENLPNQNIFAVITAGADIESSKKSIELAKKYNYIYAAVGIHPENLTEEFSSECIGDLKKLIQANDKVVAVGEIGLDYHFRSDNKEIQKKYFSEQINLANELNLPVLVHDRDAHGDTMEILKNYQPKGIVHCFSGSIEMAREVVRLGMYLGVGGVVTFKNAKNIVEVVRQMPLEVLVLETDAPYLAPVPMRGSRCDSSMIKYTAEKIAEIKAIDVQKVLKITKNNAKNLFNVKSRNESDV